MVLGDGILGVWQGKMRQRIPQCAVLRRIEIQQSAVHIKQQAIIKGQKTPRPFCAKIESIVTIIHDLSAFVNRAGDKILLRQQKAAGMPAAVCFKFE